MTRLINVHDAKTHLSRLLDDVKAGEEVILAKGGRPYARLVPYEKPRRELGFLAGLQDLGDAVMAPLTADELAAYEAEL